jgi:hypothetical protein
VLSLDLVLDPEVEISRVPRVGLARKDTGDLVALLHKHDPMSEDKHGLKGQIPFQAQCSELTLTAMVSWVYMTVCFQCVY